MPTHPLTAHGADAQHDRSALLTCITVQPTAPKPNILHRVVQVAPCGRCRTPQLVHVNYSGS